MDAFKEIPVIHFYGRSTVELNIQHAVEKDIGDVVHQKDPMRRCILSELAVEGNKIKTEIKIDGIQARIVSLKKDNESIKMGNQELGDIIKRQQERIKDIEKEVGRKNLVIEGIKEEEQENGAIVLEKIKEIVEKLEV
ncbi:hypothetical protein FQA39_LY08732 [Lamprigera yunnana]|nr:hypothetical protein FQA39_LY08732 [Lamprigera yunnana]